MNHRSPAPYGIPARRSIPWQLVCIVAALTLTLALILILRSTFDPTVRAQAQAELARSNAIADAVQPVDIFTAALWRLIPPLLLIAASATSLLILWRRYGWRESIGAHFLLEGERAKNPALPRTLHTLTYSPNQRSERPTLSAPAQLTGAEPEEGEGEDAPTFRTLLDSGKIGRDATGKTQPLILGYHAGQAITGDWRTLYSSGLGGLQGSGKTSTAAFILAQSALCGARFIVGDPHAGDAESLAVRIAALAPAFLCDIAEDDKSILHALRLADGYLQRRKHGDPDRTPIIVAIDEWSSLRRGQLADLLPQFIEDFSTEGRKLNCHVMLLGQRWDKASVGDFRNTLASSYVHRMRADEARMMTGLRASALPADTLQLPPGVAYLLDTRGSLTRVQIPYTTPTDVQAIGRQLRAAESQTDPAEAGKAALHIGFRVPSQTATGNHTESNGKATPETKETAFGSEKLDPEEAHILTLFFEGGKSVAEIVRELWPDAASGRAYNERRAYVEQVVRTQGRKD